MSVPTFDKDEDGGASLLGPVNGVMSTIFDEVATDAPESPAEPGEETPPETGTEPAPASEDTGEPEVPETPPEDGGETPPDGEPEATGVQPPQPVVEVEDRVLIEQISTLGEKLDERFDQSFEQQAVEQAQEDYPQYIEMLKLHPLELIGKELPPIDGSDENVTFRTAEEIAQWQEAVKTILQRDLEATVEQKRQESAEVLDVIHASIQLFQDNPDLVPGSKSYNSELAKRFVALAKPYALTMNGKLTGYSIPVQGLVDQVRAQVKAEAAAPSGTSSQTPAKKAAAAPAAKPQAGVPSKAGASGGSEEDFSPMWKALGIDSVPI